MTQPKPLTEWQMTHTPSTLPRHIRRNIGAGDDGCWLWLRSRSSDGYGWASLDDHTFQAHRLVYILLIGPVPQGMNLDHLCRIRHCVNPAHLEPVTPRENLRRSPLTTTGQSCCARCGGEFTWTGRQRRCVRCERIRSREYEHARKRVAL